MKLSSTSSLSNVFSATTAAVVAIFIATLANVVVLPNNSNVVLADAECTCLVNRDEDVRVVSSKCDYSNGDCGFPAKDQDGNDLSYTTCLISVFNNNDEGNICTGYSTNEGDPQGTVGTSFASSEVPSSPAQGSCPEYVTVICFKCGQKLDCVVDDDALPTTLGPAARKDLADFLSINESLPPGFPGEPTDDDKTDI